LILVSRQLGNKATKRDNFIDTSRSIEEYDKVEKWEMIAIPAKELEDPKRPGFLLNQCPKRIWGQYVGRAVEVLESVYESI
jgi:hypothetical protein